MDKIRAIIRDLREGYIGDDKARSRLEFLAWDEEYKQNRHEDYVISKISLNIDPYQKQYSRSPETIVLERERMEELLSLMNDTIEALHPRHRFVAYQYVVEGRSQEWIAEQLGCSQPAIAQQLKTIRSFVRNRCPDLMRRYQELQRGN